MVAARAAVRAAAALAALAPVASFMTRSVKGAREAGQRDLVFMHVPYNFGHTIEKVALFPPNSSRLEVGLFMFQVLGGLGSNKAQSLDTEDMWKEVRKREKKGGHVWGHFNPDLNPVLPETGCSMYFSPQKYWPKDAARHYFGNNTVFGMLRDPYERLVAMFRGDGLIKHMGQDYGTTFNPEHVKTCNVNSGIKEALQSYIASGDQFTSSCTFLPQAEYFDGEFGITLPVDNRLFPSSMNKVFADHGYTEHISKDDVFHVSGCTEVWAGDLDAETKALVRQVYKRDFELNCKHFGYCDFEENTCIHGVAQMCPKSQCGDGKCPTDESLLR
eukprot:CAMPEP_0197877000 /NCGR_PEP_ID=MMETSP1439-20131203/5831_1 /TAXON_ID=66791 /ORGANISM="Gonyaulax spinifera, Strain CCMP409" /LENGTH=329 /DNA_ID=CAMNT_0043496319 /DNA_START=59 /DNA_END=1048 /DNA_ORIENTATION=-